MDDASLRVLERLTEVEEAAEDVLTAKQQIVDLDMKRNFNREALNALKHEMSDKEKVKVCFGNMFIKFSKSKTTQMIRKDQEQLDKEINHLRKELRTKVGRLNEIEVPARSGRLSLSVSHSDNDRRPQL
uniref:p53 and DNA damage-regulated protein 1 n=1 Tax=Nothobranchius furzeri TaxID=105023 RepID=A0A8C6M964_NOTFU